MTRKISTTTRRVLGTHFPGYGSKDGVAGHGDSVWYQDPAVYHFSIYHASHHQDPVTATPTEERTESAAIEGYFEANAKRMVYLPDGRPRDELDAAAEERDWFHSHPS